MLSVLSKKASSFQRSRAAILASRLQEPRRFLQVVAGPRQVGKTTLVRQVTDAAGFAVHWASGDEPTLRGDSWIEQQWEAARLMAGRKTAILVIDEVQKAPHWSETVKRLWDEDTRRNRRLKVVLLGSAPLLMQKGLSESLAGRFELMHLPHWSFAEMRAAFRWSLDRYLFYGGYPGAAALVRDHERWSRYVRDALIETSIARDVMLLSRIDKPALLRRVFELGCAYSGQILSYNKMLGQLQDAGNTTTLAHYLELLDAAGMVAGLPKFAAAELQKRASSPKLQVHNNALMSALGNRSFDEVRHDPESWGRVVESAVGAHLLNAASAGETRLFYWRDGDAEVDFVIQRGARAVAIEVKSGRRRAALTGMSTFAKRHKVHRQLLVGGDGIPVEEFLVQPVSHWLQA